MRPKFLLAAATSMLVGLAQAADAPNAGDLPPTCPSDGLVQQIVPGMLPA